MTHNRTSGFHKSAFDGATLLKLDIMRHYVREWLPVFLSKRSRPCVNVFDFFAGPGADALGNPGTPLIILGELRKYWQTRPVDPSVKVSLYFSDRDRSHVAELQARVEPFARNQPWGVRVAKLDFGEAFNTYLPLIRDRNSADLVILDQYGFQHMPPDIFRDLASCQTTDLICFITSSYVRRFAATKATQRYIPVDVEDIGAVSSSQVHRYICDYYRGCLPTHTHYYVAPFSIRRQANVHGLIFGSGSLYGLDKFLRVCWHIDEHTGEAIFAIDGDPVVKDGSSGFLFPEYSMPKKCVEFEANLEDFLTRARRTNQDLYRFALENGFLPKHVVDLLRSMQNAGRLVVQGNGIPLRKGSYYVSWDHYRGGQPKAFFLFGS